MALSKTAMKEAKSIVDLIQGHFEAPNLLSELYYEFALLRLTFLAIGNLEFERVNPLQNAHRDRVKTAIAWYDEHLQRAPSVAEVARSVNISVTQLRRDFYELTGDSPKALFSRLRMQKATRLLVNTSLTLDQIGEQCGFQGATDFCRAFKKVFKVTANHWRHEVNPTGGVS